MFFFFSSRRRHTRLQGDWSSDVCSSDLGWLRCPLQLPGLRIRFADRVALYSPLLWYWEIAVDRASVPHFNAAFADRANCSFWIRETGNCRGRSGRGVVGVRALPGFTP